MSRKKQSTSRATVMDRPYFEITQMRELRTTRPWQWSLWEPIACSQGNVIGRACRANNGPFKTRDEAAANRDDFIACVLAAVEQLTKETV